MKVTLQDGTPLDVNDTPVGRGGMGTGYLTPDGKTFVKLFHRPTPELERALHLVLDRYNCTRDPGHPERERYWSSLYVWPRAIVVAPRLGLTADRYPDGFMSLLQLIGPKNYARLPENARQWNRRVLIAWRLAQAVSRMHQLGVAHSDLSQNNVLAHPVTGEVRIIDIDGLVVPEFVPPTVMGTPGYMAPEILSGAGRPGVTADKHSLAVLLHQLLLFAHPLKGPHTYDLDPFSVEQIEARQLGTDGIYIAHPSDARNRPSKGFYPPSLLGPTLQGLFERTFVAGLKEPSARPQASEWKIALGRLTDRLITCQNPGCQERFYPVREGQPIRCPWCETPMALQGGLPALRLYDPGPTGPALLRDFWISAYPGRTLHTWHLSRGLEPDVFHPQSAMAKVEHGAQGWHLQNLGITGLAELGPEKQVLKEVAVGDRLPLSEGTVLRLGSAPEARFCFVQWVR